MSSVEMLRLGAAAVALVVLVFWTYRRATGGGADPTLRMQKDTETGSSSFLVSGVDAVVLVATVFAFVALPEIRASPGLLLIPLGFVAAHWVVEKMEAT